MHLLIRGHLVLELLQNLQGAFHAFTSRPLSAGEKEPLSQASSCTLLLVGITITVPLGRTTPLDQSFHPMALVCVIKLFDILDASVRHSPKIEAISGLRIFWWASSCSPCWEAEGAATAMARTSATVLTSLLICARPSAVLQPGLKEGVGSYRR